jgi:hypothetical protein
MNAKPLDRATLLTVREMIDRMLDDGSIKSEPSLKRPPKNKALLEAYSELLKQHRLDRVWPTSKVAAVCIEWINERLAAEGVERREIVPKYALDTLNPHWQVDRNRL